jgi:hypothetical protein
MKTNVVQQDLNCPSCHTPGKRRLFKVAGRPDPMCEDCFGAFCEGQGPSKTVEIDGIHHAVLPDGPGAEQAERM